MSEGAARDGGFFYVLNDAVRILFVDDDPIMREFATVHLSTDKAEVALAGDGVEALEAIAADAPDIVLLDLEMPRLDGFETLERLRANPATRELPVIVVTGREDVAAIDRAFETGATSFLVKPINWRLLSYQIRYVLRAGRPETSERREIPQPAYAPTLDAAALLSLTRESAELIRLAVKSGPELRRTAVSYAAHLADALDATQGRSTPTARGLAYG